MARRIALVIALASAGCSSPAPTQGVPRPSRAIGTRPAPSSPTTTSVPATLPPTTALTPPVVVRTDPPPTSVTPPVPTGGGSPTSPDVDATLACIRSIESGGRYDVVSRAGHAGAYQFARGTWTGAVTRAGHPEWADRPANEAPPAVQDAAAAQLLAERGLQPWPTPSRRCA